MILYTRHCLSNIGMFGGVPLAAGSSLRQLPTTSESIDVRGHTESLRRLHNVETPTQTIGS